MMLRELDGPLNGRADGRLEEIVHRFERFLGNDPDYSFQAVAYQNGQPVLDIWGGPHLSGDSVLVPYSVTKNTIGLSVGLLVQRGQLELDRRVSEYWPEFAAKDKQDVTVRMLLSHQAGLPQADPALTWAELLDHHEAAARLADSRPFWRPGTAFGYHAITIGNLASELVHRITGQTLNDFFESEIRSPYDLDFYLGLPAAQESRRAPVLSMVQPVGAEPFPPASPLTTLVMRPPGPGVDLANDEVSWRFGHPGASGTGSARGLARMFAAAVTGLEGGAPFLDADTVGVVGQQQVRGYDEVLGAPNRAHAIVFQKPSPELRFGGPRSFGHDGALGGLACVDPDTGVAFAYTVARSPWPGGADPRAVELAGDLGRILA
jgi:CubicO group peptidase (beta-lactamase class C family)